MSETCFHRIAIIGLGLIGGSWGLALKEQEYGGIRIGCDRPEPLRSALAMGAIDRAEENPLDAIKGADLVILATPVGAILDLLSRLKGVLSPLTLVTDVGSTKVQIGQCAREALGDAVLFLGGHPLAGKERSGMENADAALFRRAYYALIPQASEQLQDARVKAFIALVTSFGARPFITDAPSHDRAVAYLSHLPQLVSTGLASLIAERQAQNSLPLELAATGFRDVTRLAESPYPLWSDICHTNLANVQAALDSLIGKLESLRERLSDGALEDDFNEAAKLREKLRDKE